MEIIIKKVGNGFMLEPVSIRGRLLKNIRVAENFESLIRLLEEAFGQMAEGNTGPILSDSFSAPPWPFAAVAGAYRKADHFTEKDRDVSIAIDQIRENQNA